MLLPVVMLPLQGRKMVYSPIKSAIAFDAVPDLSSEQCEEVARTELKEAVQSIAAALSSG